MSIKITAVVAMDQNRLIGKDNDLPWHIPEDLKFFKDTTMGHPIVMGRKSFESIGRPLPGRTNIVISRTLTNSEEDSKKYYTGGSTAVDVDAQSQNGPLIFNDIEVAVEEACSIASANTLSEVFIIGGSEIFKFCLPFTDKIYLTLIHGTYEGDVYFPKLKKDDWTETERVEFSGDPEYSRITLERNNK
jgi:dihydrofolate reductase